MTKNTLLTAGYKISPIAMGCEQLGGTDWGEVDFSVLRDTVRRSVDKGIKVYDTADVYGLGRSEEELSKALGGFRHEATIVTKFGVRWETSKSRSRAHTSRDSSPAYLKTALEGSLRRLKIETIPVYLVHWPDDATPLDYTLEALERAKDEGKIVCYGLSNFDKETFSSYSSKFNISAMEIGYNLIQRTPGHDLCVNANNNNIFTLTYGPLAQGLLSGKYNEHSKFVNSDRRHRLPQFLPDRWESNRNVLNALGQIAKMNNKSIPQVAIRWILDQKFVDSVVVGLKSPIQLDSVVDVLNWKLAESDKNLLDNLNS